MQSRQTDLITKLRQLLTDLLITGYTFFRVKTLNGNIKIEVLNPLNTFVDRNPESPYVKDSYRAVVRKWMSKSQIISIYGKQIKPKDLKTIKESWDEAVSNYRITYGDFVYQNDSPENPLPGYPSYNNTNLIPVYEVEWIETDDDFTMQRYKTVRIGSEIYVLYGLDKNVIRSVDNPKHCDLSINGVYFLNRSYEPYSLILKCASLQDRYDLLFYYRDNVVAYSGVSGVIMDDSLLPTKLGVSWPERVQKWLAYKKQGIMWIDTAQEGRNETGSAPINTIFNGFDDSLKAQAIQAINLAIDSVEQITSSITGVFRERLNGIEQRDAVSNIKQGVTNSFIVTKHYFQQMDLITVEMLLSSLNEAKVAFKKGLTGTIILGDKYQKIFTALPEHYTVTDFDIHITASSEVMEDIQTLKSIIPEFIKSQSLTPDIIFEAVTSKSLTDLKHKVQKALKLQKEENNQVIQLSQQLEEAQAQMQKMQSELQKSQSKIQQLDEARIKLEQEKIQLDYQVNWYKVQTDRTYKDRVASVEEKRTEIELLQLKDGNPYNDKIREV